MSGRAAGLLAWSLCTVTLVLAAAYALLLYVNGEGASRDSPVVRGMLLILMIALPVCGLLVSSRRPRNPIGWLLLAGALSVAAWGVTFEYSIRSVVVAPGSLPAGEFAAWLQGWVYAPLLLVIAPGLALFPEGDLPSPRWRPVVWLSVLAFMFTVIGSITAAGPLLEGRYVENPTGVDFARAGEAVWLVISTAAFAGSALAPIIRFRGAGPVERQQLKWLALAGILFAVSFPAVVVLDSTEGAARDLSDVVYTLALLAFPIAITLAILRHGLYDVDRIINRTLVYGALTASTIASYLLLVASFGWLVRHITPQGSSELAVAGTTLVVAAMFQPARRRIQSLVDRRFYRSRYDAALTLEAFQSRLRDQTDFDSLHSELLAIVQGTVQPARVSLWLLEERPGGPTS